MYAVKQYHILGVDLIKLFKNEFHMAAVAKGVK